MTVLSSSRGVAAAASLLCLSSLVMPWARRTRIENDADGKGVHSTFELVGYQLGHASPADGSQLAQSWFGWWLVFVTVVVFALAFITTFKPGWRWTVATLIAASVALLSSWPPISGLREVTVAGSQVSTVSRTLFGCAIWRLNLLVIITVTMVGGYFSDRYSPTVD